MGSASCLEVAISDQLPAAKFLPPRPGDQRSVPTTKKLPHLSARESLELFGWLGLVLDGTLYLRHLEVCACRLIMRSPHYLQACAFECEGQGVITSNGECIEH